MLIVEAALPSVEVIDGSIKGVKAELHVQEWVLLKYSRCKRNTAHCQDPMKYYAKGVIIIRKINKLKAIVKDLQTLKVLIQYRKIKVNGTITT